MVKKSIFLIILLLISVSVYYYFYHREDNVTDISYEFTKIEKGNIKKIVSATGTIVPISEIVISSEISGKIVNIFKYKANFFINKTTHIITHVCKFKDRI